MAVTFKRVPFLAEWGRSSADLPDAKAIYRRPRTDRWGRRVGGWDLTGPLPLRRHGDYAAKGYEYVTLASNEDLALMANYLRAANLNPADYLNGPGRLVWDVEAYLAAADTLEAEELAELRALCEEYGVAAVQKIKRQTDPTWTLPAALADLASPKAKGKGAAA